jgi:hypothetical protein
MLKSLLVTLTICLLVTACQPVNQNTGVAAGAIYNDGTLPTALSFTTVLPTATTGEGSAGGDQGGKLSAQSQANTPSPVPAATATATASPTPAPCTETQGTMVSSQMVTDLLPSPLIFRVYLPPCYRENPPVRYPLL